jgi:uncharacterized protein (TIGR02246 family)
MTRATDEVLELERQFWTRADDPDHFRSSYADEGLTVLEPMGFIGKDQAVKMVADRPWNEVEMEDVEIREVTPDVVIVAYHGTGRRDGDKEPYRGSIASTYVRQDGRWQLALTAHQPWTPA